MAEQERIAEELAAIRERIEQLIGILLQMAEGEQKQDNTPRYMDGSKQ